MSIIKKLSDSAAKVLKGKDSSAPELKEMSLQEFAVYATEQIDKAVEESADNKVMATARLKSLELSLAVAAAAFETAKLEKFELPVFSASAEMDVNVMAKLQEIDAKIDKANADKSDDKTAADKTAADKKAEDDKTAADKKAEDDKTAADKKAEDDKTAADAEAAKKAEDDKSAADKTATTKGTDSQDDGDVIWESDLAKGLDMSDEDKALYDWDTPPATAA